MLDIDKVLKRAGILYGKELPSEQVKCLGKALTEEINKETILIDDVLNLIVREMENE